MENKKLCQSCYMEMDEPSKFGTEKCGAPNPDYCCYCYKDSEFTSKMTLEEAVEANLEFWREGCDNDDQARAQIMSVFPTLKRWKKGKHVMHITFKLKSGVSADEILQASDKIQSECISKCNGFVSRYLFVHEDVWRDILVWETMEDAHNAMAETEKHPSTEAFTSLIGEVCGYVVAPIAQTF